MFGAITWDETLSARLAKLWKTHTSTEIAAIFASEGYAVTRNSVIGRAHRMGLTGKNKSVVHQNTTKSVEPQRPKIVRSKYNNVPTINHGPRIEREDYKPAVIDVVTGDIRLVDLGPTQCRFATVRIDDEWRFCAHPVKVGSSFCAAHHALCWTPRSAPAKQRPLHRERAAA